MSLYGFIATSSVKSPLSFRSTRTVPATGSYSTPQVSVVSPSRFRSPASSPPTVTFSAKSLNWYEPAGAFQVRPSAVKTEPFTGLFIRSQVPSPSPTGSVDVTQSTTLRSPVLVFCRAGWPRSTPESRMPMVTPRPSDFGCCFTKSTAPVSKDGLYGFLAGVFLPGAA